MDKNGDVGDKGGSEPNCRPSKKATGFSGPAKARINSPKGPWFIGISEDGQWDLTDQSDTAVPLKEVSVMEQAQPAGASATTPPPPVPAHLLRTKVEEAAKPRDAASHLSAG